MLESAYSRMIALLSLGSGCAGPEPTGAPFELTSLREEAAADAPWISTGLPPVPPRARFRMPRSEQLRFLIAHGSTGWLYPDCVSVAQGQPTIEDDAQLPVGDGRSLVCTSATAEPPATIVTIHLSEDGRFWCWKGAADEYRTGGDPRLTVHVAATPADDQWTFRATSEEAWTVQRVSLFVGVIWPLWIEVHYRTVDFAPAQKARCDDVF